MTTTTKQVYARRSCRIAQRLSLGSFQNTITVREKIFNPTTERMVYIDGITGKSIMNTPSIKKEFNYFEMMLDKLKNEEPTPTRGYILIRKSVRLRNKEKQREDDGLSKTIKIKKKNNIHIGDTIRILTDTIKL